jgi:hypothetical protein
MRYQIRNAQGRTCCVSHDIKNLCQSCQKKATAEAHIADAPSLADALRAARNISLPPAEPVAANGIPAPPDLAAAIRHQRALEGRSR